MAAVGLPQLQYAGHSFRIIAATTATLAGVEDSTSRHWAIGTVQHTCNTSGCPVRGWPTCPQYWPGAPVIPLGHSRTRSTHTTQFLTIICYAYDCFSYVFRLLLIMGSMVGFSPPYNSPNYLPWGFGPQPAALWGTSEMHSN